MDIKRTWSIPTSPRNPYKLSDELTLLAKFEGKKWNKETQGLYAKGLVESEFYEGKIYAKEPEFSARDRVNRSPKTFGFVRFDDENKIKITKAGKQLIAGIRIDELFLRQLLKWQYPSPKHKGRLYEGFKIKPFLEVLRLAFELEGLSKKEIAMFCVPLVNYGKYDEIKIEIVNFRAQMASLRGIERRRLLITAHAGRFKRIYNEEIRNGSFRLRQQRGTEASIDTFLRTKVSNSIDYADAAIRYFRATGLFKLSATTFRLQVIESKLGIVKEVLNATPREPLSFEDEGGFLDFLSNPDLPALPDDRPEVLQAEVASLVGAISSKALLSKDQLDTYRQEKLVSASVPNLKESRDKLEKILADAARQTQVSALQSYSLYDDIIRMYEKVVHRADYDIPDKPLFFEWNTWRAFVMLDDGEVVCNALLDKEGKPLSTAPGGAPDGVGYYQDFVLTIEVTLARGERQFETENESVPRHLGKIIKSMRENADTRPAFGFFIASGLNMSTVAHFYSLRRSNVLHYGGKAKIIPLDLNAFKHMLAIARGAGGIKASELLAFLKWVDQEADRVENENEWYLSIERKIPEWTKC